MLIESLFNDEKHFLRFCQETILNTRSPLTRPSGMSMQARVFSPGPAASVFRHVLETFPELVRGKVGRDGKLFELDSGFEILLFQADHVLPRDTVLDRLGVHHAFIPVILLRFHIPLVYEPARKNFRLDFGGPVL